MEPGVADGNVAQRPASVAVGVSDAVGALVRRCPLASAGVGLGGQAGSYAART
jgi:hypothetical protein